MKQSIVKAVLALSLIVGAAGCVYYPNSSNNTRPGAGADSYNWATGTPNTAPNGDQIPIGAE